MKSTSQDLAILGIGVQSALGDTEATWDALCAGRTAVRELVPGAYAARVDAPTLGVELPRELAPQLKFLSGSGVMAALATREAWDASESQDVPDHLRGLYLAQMDAEDWNCNDFRNAAHAASEHLDTLEQVAMNQASLRHLKPFFLLEGLKNNAFSFLATWMELRGANSSTAGATSLGAALLGMGGRAIQQGALRRCVLTGAARMSSSTALRELELQSLQATTGSPAPHTTASGGLIPGDAAAAIVIGPLQERPDAQVAIAGIGSATCLSQEVRPQADAVRAAAADALRAADVQAGQLRAVVAPGTGLPAEHDALEDLPTGARDTPVVCFAGATGHASLAGDTLDLALATRALQVGTLPAAYMPEGADATLATLAPRAIDVPPGSALLVLSLSVFGHAGAVVLRSLETN